MNPEFSTNQRPNRPWERLIPNPKLQIQGAVPGGDAFRPTGLAVGAAMLGAGKAVGSGQMVEF